MSHPQSERQHCSEKNKMTKAEVYNEWQVNYAFLKTCECLQFSLLFSSHTRLSRSKFGTLLGSFSCWLMKSLILVQWQTTWDRSKLFTSLALSSPINFVTPDGATGSADIVINDGIVYQSIAGFGGSLSNWLFPMFLRFLIASPVADTSALTLNDLKASVIMPLPINLLAQLTSAVEHQSRQLLEDTGIHVHDVRWCQCCWAELYSFTLGVFWFLF